MPNTLDIPFEFYYRTETPVPIPEIVLSLQAMEKVVRSSIPVFNHLIEGCDLADIDIYVDEIKSGSLKDNFLVRLIFGSEDGMNKWIDTVRDKSGISGMSEKAPIFGPVITSLLLFGAGAGVVKMFGPSGPKMNIEADNSVVIQLCAETINIPAEMVKEALGEVKNKTNLAINACKVLHPARSDVNASIIVDGQEKCVISSGSIQEAPPRVERTDPVRGTETFENQRVIVRAMDLDNTKKGWACTVPGIVDDRIKVDISAAVNPASLLRTDGVMVHITLEYKYTEEGDKVYKRGHILGLVE